MPFLPVGKRRWILVGLAAIVVMLAGALAVRLALRPARLQAIAEAELTRLLGQPIRVGSMDVSVFPFPHVTGRDVVVGSGTAAAAPSLTLRQVVIVPELRSLFRQPFVVRRVDLEGIALAVL